MSQRQMDLGPIRRTPTNQQLEIADFHGGLRYRPTKVRAYEVNGHLLFVHHYEHKQDVGPAHRKLFKTMVRYGEARDSNDELKAPGSVTVVCLWGAPGLGVGRYIRIFDARGDTGKEPATDDSIKAGFSDWEARMLRS